MGNMLERVKSARQWVQENPRATFILALLSFIFIFLPQWASAVWSLFLDEPLIPSVLKKMNIQVLSFSLTWITAPIGLAILFTIAYLLITGTKSKGIEHSTDTTTLAPNIVCLGESRLDFVEFDRHQVFRESNYYGAGALRAVAVEFTNAPKPPERVTPISNVTAQIVFYDAEWPDREEYRVNHACWLNEESPYVSFNLDTIHYLIVGVCQHKRDGTDGFEPDFTIYGNSPDRNSPLLKYPDRFTARFKIKVKLIVGEHGNFSSEHHFELEHTPGQGCGITHITEEESQKRKVYINGELMKLIARGEQFVTTPLINPGWDKLYEDIHKWTGEVSALLQRNFGIPLSSRFTSVNEVKPYPHKISEGRRSFFDELYTRIENLKEIAREQGAPVPATDVSKQIQEVTNKRREEMLKDLARFAADATALLDYTKMIRLSTYIRDLHVWDSEIFDYLSANLDRADAALIIEEASVAYTLPADAPSGCHDFLRQVNSRLVRLNNLIDAIQSGRRAL